METSTIGRVRASTARNQLDNIILILVTTKKFQKTHINRLVSVYIFETLLLFNYFSTLPAFMYCNFSIFQVFSFSQTASYNFCFITHDRINKRNKTDKKTFLSLDYPCAAILKCNVASPPPPPPHPRSRPPSLYYQSTRMFKHDKYSASHVGLTTAHACKK